MDTSPNSPGPSPSVERSGKRQPQKQAPSLPAATSFLEVWLGNLWARLSRRAAVFVSGRFWAAEVTLLAICLSLLLTGGVDSQLSDFAHWKDCYGHDYLQKIEHPLNNVAQHARPEEHAAKLNFRLTVPVLLHLAGVTAQQAWILPLLTTLCICAIMATMTSFAYRLTQDRICGLLMGLTTACLYNGSFSCIFFYDSVAYLLLLGAVLPTTHWGLKGLLVLAAAFTDERALLASTLVAAQLLCLPQNTPSGCRRARSIFLGLVAIGTAWSCYGAGRFILARYFDLTSPMSGVGLQLACANAPYWHSTFWFGLEGGWLLCALATLALCHQRRWLALAGFVGSIFAVVASSLLVADQVRSAAYALPALLVALSVLSPLLSPQRLRFACGAAFLFSVLAGDYEQIFNLRFSSPMLLHRLVEPFFPFPLQW